MKCLKIKFREWLKINTPGLVGHVRTKIASHNAMPGGVVSGWKYQEFRINKEFKHEGILLFVHLLFDECRDILLHVVLF